mgnify:CR=1 FL=1
MNTMTLRRAMMSAAVSAGLLAGLQANPAEAVETINMIAIDGYPDRSMWVKEFSGFFIPRVDEELAKTGNYKINWQEAYGGTIVKPRGVLEGIKLGLGDIGIVTTIFHNSALPSQGISAVTPFVAADARVVAKAVDEIAREFPQMAAELDAENRWPICKVRKSPVPGIICAIWKVLKGPPACAADCRISTTCFRPA